MIDLAGVVAIGQRQRLRAVPLSLDDCDSAVRQDAADAGARGQVLESCLARGELGHSHGREYSDVPTRRTRSRPRPTFCSNGWFNVRSVGEQPYVLLDRASRNFLGEFETFPEAEAALLRFVAAEPGAAGGLEVWHEERERVAIDPEKLRGATNG